MKILIIEDEPSLREVMQRALEQERYIVETAATYAEADARIAAYSYDCILLDIMLPDGSGLRLLEHIKHLRRRDNVIIISARDSLDDKVEGGNVSLDVDKARVTVDGREVPLLKKEFDILLYLMQRPNHLVDKTVLAEAVWGDHADDADNFQFVYAQMKNLRRKMAEAGATAEIKSVYGFGYKLVPPQQ